MIENKQKMQQNWRKLSKNIRIRIKINTDGCENIKKTKIKLQTQQNQQRNYYKNRIQEIAIPIIIIMFWCLKHKIFNLRVITQNW